MNKYISEYPAIFADVKSEVVDGVNEITFEYEKI